MKKTSSLCVRISASFSRVEVSCRKGRSAEGTLTNDVSSLSLTARSDPESASVRYCHTPRSESERAGRHFLI